MPDISTIYLFEATDCVFYLEEDTTQISYESGIKGNYNHSCCISNNHWLKDPYLSRMESNVLSIEVKIIIVLVVYSEYIKRFISGRFYKPN